LVLGAIELYRHRLSPRKGYSCAYRVVCGHASCSTLGLRVVRRFGVRRGVPLLRQRLARCADVHRRRQRGSCDVGCDVPGLGSGVGSGAGSGSRSGRSGRSCSACDLLDCGDCADCDLERRTRDGIARHGPGVLWALVIALAMAAVVLLRTPCEAPCLLLSGTPIASARLAWCIVAALSGCFGALIVWMRVRRSWSVASPLLGLAALVGMSIVVGGRWI
jgi:uncharacterized protein